MGDPLNAFLHVIAPSFFLWGTLAIMASILLLVLYSCYPDLRRTPGWQFLYSSLCEIAVSTGFVCFAVVAVPHEHSGIGPSSAADIEQLLCTEYHPLLLTILAFDVAANSWRLLMYLDLIIVYHNPFRPNTWRPLYHITVAVVATLSTIAMSSSGVLCTQSEQLSVGTLTWGLIYAPFLLFIAVGGSLYAAVKALLSRGESNNPISQLARQRVMQHCLQYLLLYGSLFGLLAGAYTCYQLRNLSMVMFAYIAAALTAGRPVLGCIGWLLINQVHKRWCRNGSAFAVSPTVQRRFISLDFAQPLLSMDVASEDAVPSEGGIIDQQLHHGAAQLRETWLSIDQGVREAGFKEELRYELVADVTMAISELAEREAREHSRGMPTAFSPRSCSSTSPDLSRSDLFSPVNPNMTRAYLDPGAPTQHVQHYAVAHFRAIREAFGVSAESFAAAFRHSREWSKPSRRLRESVSEGASGSFFYWVKRPDGSDTGFIVKQISKQEKNTLMSILPTYMGYIQARGGASLLHYLSCHSMQLRWQWSGKVYFVVMRNIFPVRPQLSFDLKGATANRRALKTWELHQTNTVAGLYSTLRDWEWMDIGMTTELEDSDAARIWSMICTDSDYLHRQHLLDYSLLLGIYRPAATLSPQQKQATLQQLARQCRGCAAVSRDRQKIYFFGIIDILEKFSLRWRVQRAVLRLLYCLAMRWRSADGISAMPPTLYADRFRTFMAHEVLQISAERDQHPLDERWRAASFTACLCACKRVFGLGTTGRAPRKGGRERWQPLWARRRRGLVRQRIDSELEDAVARIKELEERVLQLESELAPRPSD